jgi:hypothetical protein
MSHGVFGKSGCCTTVIVVTAATALQLVPNEPVIGLKNGRCSRSVTSKLCRAVKWPYDVCGASSLNEVLTTRIQAMEQRQLPAAAAAHAAFRRTEHSKLVGNDQAYYPGAGPDNMANKYFDRQHHTTMIKLTWNWWTCAAQQ